MPTIRDNLAPAVQDLESLSHRDHEGWTPGTTAEAERWRDAFQVVQDALRVAPDHAMLLSALVAGLARWEPFHPGAIVGEVCVRGMRHSTRLDADGCPVLTTRLRAELHKALAAR